MKENSASFVLGSVAVFLVPAVAPAATIAWGPAVTIAGDTDVVNQGSLVAADNFGTSTVTTAVVNGVTFSPFAINTNSQQATYTQGNVSLTETQTYVASNLLGTAGSSSTPFSTLSAGYQNLLANYATAGVVESLVLTVSGLTPGQQYLFEGWSDFSAAANTNQTSITGGPTLLSDSTNTVGGVGQYALGNFVADAASQSITFSAGGGDIAGTGSFPILSGFEVRAVPEPASATVLMTGLFATLRRRNKQNRAAN